MLAAILSVIVPCLFWSETWFGRQLTDREIQTYLHDRRHPRNIQHALSQMAGRMMQRDTLVRAWYPEVAALARDPLPELRTTAAWVMGQDNRSEAFHRALRGLLGDPEVMVRRNAALALVRFGDDAGRAELIRILEPWLITSPAQGRIRIKLEPDQEVGRKALLARLQLGGGREIEVRSPGSGRVAALYASNNSWIGAGTRLLSLRSDPDEVWEALRGLYLVGRSEDLPAVEQYVRIRPAIPDHVRRQATLTAQAIRMRVERNPIR
jgi:hypothetical protein